MNNDHRNREGRKFACVRPHTNHQLIQQRKIPMSGISQTLLYAIGINDHRKSEGRKVSGED